MLGAMAAATQLSVDTDSSWRISRDGDQIAVVAVRQEAGEVVVATELGTTDGPGIDPCRFPSLQAAESFLGDLIASFSYLGCDVVRA